MAGVVRVGFSQCRPREKPTRYTVQAPAIRSGVTIICDNLAEADNGRSYWSQSAD